MDNSFTDLVNIVKDQKLN